MEYIQVWNSEEKKYRYEHRLVMERFIGRKLTRNEVVHHKNGNKRDNRLENLEIMERSRHTREHNEKLPQLKVCTICGNVFRPSTHNRGRTKVCSLECKKKAISIGNKKEK